MILLKLKRIILLLPQGDVRYINEPISENLNMNGFKIINCATAHNDNDVVVLKDLEMCHMIMRILT